MITCRPSRTSCKPVNGSKRTSLKSLIAEYRQRWGRGAEQELDCFREMPSMELAIHHVAFATDDEDVCFEHQYRIIRPARRRAEAILIEAAARLEECRSFHELHTLLTDRLMPVPGLGEMYIYDAAVRMGAFLNLSPTLVYLHCGTRDGARALGMDVKRPFLEIRNLPKELRGISAGDLESFLCIFKNRF